MEKKSKVTLVERMSNCYRRLMELEKEYDYQEDLLKITKGYEQVHAVLVRIDELRAMMTITEGEIEEIKDKLCVTEENK